MQRFLMAAALLITCLTCSSYSVYRGQDTNFDQRNYHYYDVWSFLNGTPASYEAPAGVQSFLNPLAEVIPYELVRHCPPRLAGAVLGAISGLLLVPLYLILKVLTSSYRSLQRRTLIGITLLISACSPLVISEVGTTFSDDFLSIPNLFSVFFVLAASPLSYLIAGMLMGLSCGIKLTGIPYAIALAVATIVGPVKAGSAIRHLSAVAAGGFLGFVITGGSWAITLYRKFGDPVFPWWNGVFRSSDFPPINASDPRLQAHTLLDVFRYPVRWALGDAPTNEIPFQDIRFATILIVIIMVVTWRLLKIRRTQVEPRSTTPADLRLVVFFGIAFIIWIFQFGIQRYAVTLELLTGPVLLVIIRQLPDARIQIGSMGLAALAALITFRTCDWGHAPWKPRWFDVTVPKPVLTPSIVILGAAPLSYIVPFLPKEDEVFGSDLPIFLTATSAARPAAAFRAAVASGRPMWLVSSQRAIGKPLLADLAETGLFPSSVCYHAGTGLETLSYCRLSRRPR